MIQVELGDKKVNIPTKWEEVKFEKFLDFMNLTKTFKTDKELDELNVDEDLKEFHVTLENLKTNTKMVSFWTGISEDELAMCDIDEVGQVIEDLKFLTAQYTPVRIESFDFEGEKYYLPKADMAKETFGTYVEAEQVEMNNARLKKGKLEVLPQQVAILCKKKDEKFISDDEVDKRAEKFKKLDMATIWDVGFFLTRQESLLTISFLTLTKEHQMLKQELQQKEQ